MLIGSTLCDRARVTGKPEATELLPACRRYTQNFILRVSLGEALRPGR